MKIIDKILSSSWFKDAPPVLVDIGASGEIHSKWKAIAPYSVCIAFDADDREFRIDEQTDAVYRKLVRVNRIVSADAGTSKTFYLTASPFCSSLLEPDTGSLQPWVFQDLFRVEKSVTIPSITLADALGQAGIAYLDWFKTDTQGTDLRLFQSLPAPLTEGLLAAEFEPGIMDAYRGEDKLHMVMQQMERSGYWLSSMEVKGTQRLQPHYTDIIGKQFVKRVIRRSPCWAEVCYLRQPQNLKSERQFLLLCVFSLLENQPGFALEVMDEAMKRFKDPFFATLKKDIQGHILAGRWKTPLVIMKRQLSKLFARIHD